MCRLLSAPLVTTACIVSDVKISSHDLRWNIRKNAADNEGLLRAIPAIFAFTVTFGSSVYTPGYLEVSRRFNVSPTAAILGLSLYVLGLAFGPVLAAPISETKGRKVVYLTTLPVAALFTLGAGFSKSLRSLVITRFFAGFFASPVLAVGGGTNNDLWFPVYRANATSLFLLAPFLGPALGPVLGGFVAQHKGWRWTQWLILFVMVPAYLFSLGMEETYKKILLQKQAKKLGLPPPPRGLTGLPAMKFLLTVTLVRPVRMLLTEPIVILFSLYTGFNFSVLFGFFDAFPIVFGGVYGFSIGLTGLCFLGIGLGCALGSTTGLLINRLYYNPLHAKSLAQGRGGVVAPEYRLYSAMMGSFGIPVSLFWFAWTAQADIYFISPILATIPFAWGNMSVFMAAAMYLSDAYGPLNGASALAANGLVRYSLGAAFPLFTVQSEYYDDCVPESSD